MPAPTIITVDKLARLIGTPAVPAVVDIREVPDVLIPGAVPRSLDTIDGWAAALAGRPAVVVDADGSAAHGVAALLRAEGVAAEMLEGGHAAWQAAGLPCVSAARLPPRDARGRTTWVTRARPKVDRIACPWLIRRFVDPDARFLFVPPGEVLPVAAQLGAHAFDLDAPEVEWQHHGAQCTFDAMLAGFGLDGWAPLVLLAGIVRGADTARLDIAPQAAGLLAISLGLSRMYADDLAQLDAGMAVYDALFRWCRDAQGETHDPQSHAVRGKGSR